MNPKNTWLWVLVAAGLFAVVFLHDRFAAKPETGPSKLLPGFDTNGVLSVEILPANQRSIRAELLNGNWQLTDPVSFPAHAAALAGLLKALEEMVPTTRIDAQELGNMRDANEKFGFNPPPFTVVLQPGDQHIQIGNQNGPGDQVFVKVVGRDGVAVVDAGLLKLLPRSVDDWRETALVDFAHLDFDQLFVTNGVKVLQFQRNSTNGLWRMVQPMPARADSTKLIESLGKLQGLRTTQFIDNPKSELDSFGLQAPELSLAFKNGTNTALLLAFGKSVNNETNQVYARRNDEKTVLTVAREPLEPWHAAHETFRDRHLISPTGPLAAIEFHAAEDFFLRRTNSAWIVTPQNFPADPALVTALLTNLGRLQVAQFYKDVVVAPDLPALGLADPIYKISFQAVTTNAALERTNITIAEIDFGTNQDGLIYARRSDESFVYTVKLADVQSLPVTALQLRDRSIWNFSTNEVARVTVRQNGKTRQWLRQPTGNWSLAPGSQGIMDEVTSAAIEETVYRFGHLAAEAWVERGDQNLARFGFQPGGMRVTLELQDGSQRDVEFGGEASLGSPYARVTLNQEVWIFEFSPMLYQLVQSFLTLPPDVH